MQVYFVPHVEAVGGPDRAFEIGKDWLVAHALEGTPFVLAPTLKQASYDDVRELTTVGVRSGIPKNFPPRDWAGGPVLAPWANARVTERLDRASKRITSVCVLKWIESDCKEWLAARGAIDVTAPERVPASPTIGDGVVLVAMEGLTRGVNLSTGLSHSMDRMVTISRLQYLKRWGHVLDVEEIVSWALANGWSHAGAADLRDIVARLNAGRTFRGTRRFRIADRGKLLKRWVQEAEQRGLTSESA